MLTFKKTLGAILLPTLVGLSAGSAAAETKLPMQCQISVSKGQYGHNFRAVMKALETVNGFYELNLNGNGAVISQAGDFYAKAGDTQVLGEATLGIATIDDVEAEFILHVGDTKYVCGLIADI